jgi:fucose permease
VTGRSKRTRPWHSYGWVFGLALASFVLLGVADSGLGVAWPSMRSVFDRDIADLGLLLAFLSFGYLTASTGFGRIHSRFGTGRLLVGGALSLALGGLGLTTAGVWLLMPISTGVIGLGAGLIDVGMNAHAALEFDRGSVNLLHAAYGLGATLGPLLITTSLAFGFAWRGGYGVLVIVQMGAAFFIWKGRGRWHSRGLSGEPSETGSGRRLIVPVMLIFFLLYTGLEVATGQWAYTLLVDGRGLNTVAAGVWVSLYWGGLTVGRLVSGYVGDKVAASRVLDSSVLAAMLGLGLLWWNPLGLGAIGLPLTGLGFAAVFPTMVAITPARIGRVKSTRIIGYQLAAANVGAATIPWALGLFGGALGLDALAAGLVVGIFMLGLLHLWTDRTGGIAT